jgi:tetratricopeptide (TPR) repeat protein
LETQEQWLACLENVVRWQPTHVRAHLALAETHRRLFDTLQLTAQNPMSLADIRDAAINSQFPSPEVLVEWLSRAVGKHWVHLQRALYHTRQALMLCPLQGRAYVYLAELSFLSGADDTDARACVQQALRVRPFDGAVLYAAGAEARRAGDLRQSVDYWKKAIRRGRRQQAQLLGNLVASTPTEDLPAMIESLIREFQPDREGLRFLHGACLKRCPAEQLLPLVLRRAEKAEVEAASLPPAEAARVWLEAQQLYSQLGNDADALRCARQAAECDPGNYDVHYQLALCLLKQRSFAEAESQLRWCRQRMPDNQAVEGQLREALKGRLDAQRRAAVERGRR